MKIFTYAFNNPAYLEYQSKCLRKFIKEPFDLYCIDNAINSKYSNQFIIICNDNNIHYTKNEEPDHTQAGKSHYSALQWSWKKIISNTEELIVMMDHDAFPIDYVSIEELLGDAFLAGPPQARGTPDNFVEYFHPSLMIFDTQKLPNKGSISFRGSVINGNATDTGGDLYNYFKSNPDVQKTFLRAGHIFADHPLFSPKLIAKYGQAYIDTMVQTLFETIENKFLHTRNGSNWDGWKIFEDRNKFIFEILDERLQ
jgi:hypothetical protein